MGTRHLLSFLIKLMVLLLSVVASAAEPRVVRVGAFNYYPCIFQDSDGLVKGFYVDALEELGRRENIRFEYVYGSWSEGLERIRSGQVDLLTSVAHTPERTRYMDYTKTPLLTVWGELYGPRNTPIAGIKGVRGKTVAVMKGDYNGKSFIDLVHKFNIACTFVEYPGLDDVFRAVAAGEVDAGVVNNTFGTSRKGEYGVRTTGVVFNPFDIFFTVAKGKNGDLLTVLDAYLEKWRSDPDSTYNIARQEWTNQAVVYRIPAWVGYSALAFLLLISGSAVFILLLRSQVKLKTNDILQRETSLRQSSDFITLLLNSTAEAIYGIDTQGKCTFCNAACLRILGYERNDRLLGEDIHALIHHTHADGTPCLLDDCHIHNSPILGEKAHGDHEVFWRANGTSFPVEYWSYPIMDDSRVVGAVVTFIDISKRKTIEENLRESEIRYRNIFENDHLVMLVIDPETGSIVDANPAAAAYYGWSREQLREMHIGDINSLGRETVMVEMKQANSRKRNQCFFRHGLANGTIRDVEVLTGPISIAGKTLLFSTIRDITERKRIEETYQFLIEAGWLSAKEDFFTALARFLATTLDMEYIFIDRIINDGTAAKTVAVHMDGKTAENMEYPLENTPCHDVVGKPLCAYETGICEHYPKDTVLRDLAAESYVGTTLWGFDGKPIGLIAAMGRRPLTDLHLAESVLKLVAVRTAGELERKLAEEALIESGERYRALVEHAPVAVMVNRENRIVLVNQQCLQLFGATTTDQLLGKSPFDLFDPSFHPAMRDRIRRMIETGEPASLLEEKIIRLDGTPVEVEVGAVPFKDKGVGAIHVVLRDITQQKKYEKDLLDKNSELERFTYTVSHDLKSPLITIQFFAGQILQDLAAGLPENVHDDLKKVTDAAGKMNTLLNDLLDLSRIGRVMNPSVTIELPLLLDEIVAQLQGSITRRGVEIKIDSALPAVNGDPQRVAEVFQNLIENAVKYMGDQQYPRITISTRRDGHELILFVADNGIGIEPRCHENIFGLFNKLDPKSEGTGVGLALVRRIVETHGGRVWVESAGEGEGCTFCFTLPSIRSGN